MPVHIHASAGEVASVVLLPGDPGRAERLATMLEHSACYNRNRGLLGFTGAADGKRISVQTTGMGGPSAAIVAEELAMLGARVLIRVGTAGAAGETVKPGDLVVATASVPLDGTTRAYVGSEPYAPVADFTIVSALVEACKAAGAPHHVGLIVTGDALYAEDAENSRRWASRGVLAFEMEASALFTVAALRGMRAGCLVLVTNNAGIHDRLDGEAYAVAELSLLQVALSTACSLAEWSLR